jgi:NAD(P)-dependent dehydrogenase (short-subunit alcohol dehydrogenase family)
MYKLQQKTVIITGSGRRNGIGEAIALRFASEGCNIVISDIGTAKGEQFSRDHVGTTDEMESIANDVRALGGQAICVPCDVRFEKDVENLIEKTIEAFGSIDIMVNNAGVGYIMEAFTEFKETSWDAVLDVNLKGVFLCSKHAAIQMIKQGSLYRFKTWCFGLDSLQCRRVRQVRYSCKCCLSKPYYNRFGTLAKYFL